MSNTFKLWDVDSSFWTPAAEAVDSPLQDRRWTAAPAITFRAGNTDLGEQVVFAYSYVCLSSACSTQQEVEPAAGCGNASREEAIGNATTFSSSSSSSSSTYYSFSSLLQQSQTEMNSDTEESRPLLDVNKNELGGRSESRKLFYFANLTPKIKPTNSSWVITHKLTSFFISSLMKRSGF